MSQSKIIGAIEIGTAKIVVLVGEIVNGRSLNVIGMGQSSSAGVKKGEIFDFKAASNSTHAAIMGAEKSAGVNIDAVYLAQTGRHLQGFSNRGSVTVSAADGHVSGSDIKRAQKEGKSKELAQDRVYIHHIKNEVLLDGRSVEEPYHMEGERLDIGYWSIHGDERRVRDHIHVINGFGLPVEDMIVSSIASGSMVAEEEAKKVGCLVLDIGCGTTDWVLFQDGYIAKSGVVAVGGDHISNDMALGLRINRSNADKLKIQCGKAILEKDDQSEKVWMVGDHMIGDRHLPKKALVQIISLRLEELFQVVKKQIGPQFGSQAIPGGVILTGGTAQLEGITDLAKKVFEVDARIGVNPRIVNDELRGTEFSTVLGLLHYALTGQHEEEFSQGMEERGILRKVVKLIAG